MENRDRYNLFSIKPYKRNLLTPGASYWIICIHLVIFVMATSEAIAWGYLGSLFGKGALGYLAAAITFAFMFLIVWVIDVSFVTLDLSRSYYDKIILKKDTDRWVDNTRLGIGLLGRVAIVFVSLSISAPFLAQIVFKQDIDNEIERRNMATVSMVSDSMLIVKDEQIASLDSLIQVREAELIQETAGQGSSGNYGFGPVTRAIENNLVRLREERASLQQDKLVFDQTMQSLTVPEFAERYNVDLVDNGVRTREEILGGLMENPEYRTAKTAITAFLAFIFAALVLLKLFQPRSVRIYYNEKLQDLYREYLAGHLNKWIAPEEQSIDGQSQMSPLRFEDWCVSTYSVVRNEDIKRRDSRKIYNLFKMKIEQLEEEKAEIKRMMEPVEEEYDAVMQEVNEIKVSLLEAENAIRQNERNGVEIAQQLDNISEDLRQNRFAGSDVLFAVTAKKEAEAKLAENNKARLALQYDRDLVQHRFEVKDTDARQTEELMAKIRQNYRDLQEKIDRERLAYTDLVVSGQVIDVPSRRMLREETLADGVPTPALPQEIPTTIYPVDAPVEDTSDDSPEAVASTETEARRGPTVHDMLTASIASADAVHAEAAGEVPEDAAEVPDDTPGEEPVEDFAAAWRDMIASISDKPDPHSDEPEEEPETETEESTPSDDADTEDTAVENVANGYGDDPFEEAEPAYWAEALARENWRAPFVKKASDDEILEDDVPEVENLDDDLEDLAHEAGKAPGQDKYVDEEGAPAAVKYVWENEEDVEDESPVTYVDVDQLNMFADAASVAAYEESEGPGEDVEEEEEAPEAPAEEAEDALGDYFVDPALISEYHAPDTGEDESMDAGVDMDEIDDFGFTDAELAALRERLNTELEREEDEPAVDDEGEHLEDFILKELESRSGRTDRKGLIRKGTFGKSFGEGV